MHDRQVRRAAPRPPAVLVLAALLQGPVALDPNAGSGPGGASLRGLQQLRGGADSAVQSRAEPKNSSKRQDEKLPEDEKEKGDEKDAPFAPMHGEATYATCTQACDGCWHEHFQGCLAYCHVGCEEHCTVKLSDDDCDTRLHIWFARVGHIFQAFDPAARMCEATGINGCPDAPTAKPTQVPIAGPYNVVDSSNVTNESSEDVEIHPGVGVARRSSEAEEIHPGVEVARRRLPGEDNNTKQEDEEIRSWKANMEGRRAASPTHPLK